MIARLIGVVDRFGFGYAANIRGPVHYLTGCTRRAPLVVACGVAMGVTDIGTLAYNPPDGPLSALWAVLIRLCSLWVVLCQARRVARELDAGPSATLPREYPDALWVARFLMVLFLGSLAVGTVLDVLDVTLMSDPPKGPPFGFLGMLAMMAGTWISGPRCAAIPLRRPFTDRGDQ